MLIEALRLAWQAIGRNALRASLTVLGIVIGVAAVIAMVTIGKGATMKVTADIERLGGNLIFLAPGQWGPGRASSDAKPFNTRDVAALRNELPSALAIAPVSQRQMTIVAGIENRQALVRGVDNEYFSALAWDLQGGRRFPSQNC